MKIENYVHQLADDLRDLLQKVPPHALHVAPDNYEESLREHEEHSNDRRGVLVAEHCGLTAEQLPDVGLLTERQADLLQERLTDLLHHYHAIPSFPTQLPAKEMYRAIRSESHKIKSPLIAQSLIHHVFCEQLFGDCPFPGYCDLCEEARRRSAELSAEVLGFMD